jgi:transglutaminase-like putative cysteine protease
VYAGGVRLRLVLFVLAFACVVPRAASAKGDSRPSFGPAGAWVRAEPLPDPPPPAAGEAQPIVTLLSDRQVKLGKKQEEYFRRAYRVVSNSGVESGSQIEWSFDPTYERLVVHFVRVHRGGAPRNALRPNDIKVVQRETDLDARVYNGTQSAILFLHDIRVGDVIDYAYTVVGSNPILRGRAAGRFHLAEYAPTTRLSLRLVVEGERNIVHKTLGIDLAPTVETGAKTTEYLWQRENLPAVVVDDDVPSWFDPYPSVEISEFPTWNDVARWASDLFERKVRSSAELRETVARMAKAPDPASRAIAAIRFVQDDVRYLGIELGENSHQPFPPATVVDRRFGDCKDKSLLLVTLLRELGIEAHVALVDSDFEATVANHLPSPFAFDHAIVELRLDGRDIFVDPTETMVRGSLSDLVVPPYGRALVVAPTSNDLTSLPPRSLDVPLVEERQVYTVSDYEAPVRFDVETVYRRDEANSMRRHLADTPRSELARNYLNYYAKVDAKISAESEPEIVDDVVHNVITVRESYRIPAFWDDDERSFSAGLVETRMADPRITRRTMPLAIDHPDYVAQTIEVRLPDTFEIENESKEIASSGFRFSFSAVNFEKKFELRYEYKSVRDSIGPGEMDAYRARLDEVKKLTGYAITRPSSKRSEAMDWKRQIHVLGGTLLGMIGLAVVGAAALRGPAYVRRLRFRRQQRLESGEGPATAILASDEVERSRHFERMRCTCGGRWLGAQEETQVRYGEGFVTVLRTTCASCGRDGRLYFRDA